MISIRGEFRNEKHFTTLIKTAVATENNKKKNQMKLVACQMESVLKARHKFPMKHPNMLYLDHIVNKKNNTIS